MYYTQDFDYIVVGQGLAGSALSYQLIKAGKSVLVIDQDNKHTSSKVAAGLYNPVTGRKMVKTWNADLLFPYLVDFYKEIEAECHDKFLHEIPIYRPFISMEEQNEWMGKSSMPEYEKYVKQVHRRSYYRSMKDEYGGIELNYSGYLDIPRYLTAIRKYLLAHEMLLEECFDINSVVYSEQLVSYKQYRANKLIFCEGVQSTGNQYWDWLPFKPVKGEILKIRTDLQANNILNRGVFVVPLEEGVFRVGSNYNNHDLTVQPTAKALEEIEGKLNELIDIKYEIIDHVAGVRPATRDRRPFLGVHPQHPNIGIFNGLGAKGVSLAPYYAEHYLKFLESGEELQQEVNISRYFSLYYDSLDN